MFDEGYIVIESPFLFRTVGGRPGYFIKGFTLFFQGTPTKVTRSGSLGLWLVMLTGLTNLSKYNING